MTQFRMWVCTLNNPDSTTVAAYLESWTTKAGACYATGQLEKGKEGTSHVQFFVQFKEQKRIGTLKKFCKKAHFTGVKWNNGADTYCNKEETRVEGPWTYGI